MAADASRNFLLTTHYLDLCFRLEENAKLENVHMKTTLQEGRIKYDYTLVKGVSAVKGGLEVLKALEFPPDVIECAQKY
jgi:DNA mismatch repair ATPase MutS